MTLAEARFVRTETTRLGYGAITAYAYWLYAFGPALALLRDELHFSYTLIGVYSALWSGGAAVSGLVFEPIVRRAGRALTLWTAVVAATAGAALFGIAHSVPPGLVAAGLLGFSGTTVLSIAQSVLADAHGERRDKALVEANVAAAGCAVVAPLLLGALAVTPAGWRVTFAIPALAFALLWLAYRHVPLPDAMPHHDHEPTRSRRLPLTCWLLTLLTAIGIAVEFCPVYFGTEQLRTTGLSTTSAATALGAFYLGILAGRIAGAALTVRQGRTVTLLWASLALTAGGFVLFWLTDQPVAAVLGLFLAGAGIANLYPLSLALALAAAQGRTDAANALTQLLGGIAVVLAPYLLGTLADQVGLRAAFSVELVLVAASALLLFLGRRTAPRTPPAPPTQPSCPCSDTL